MEDHTREELTFKILKLEVQLFKLDLNLSHTLSNDDAEFLHSQSKVLEKTFELYYLCIKRGNHTVAKALHDIIQEHLISLQEYFKKIRFKQKSLGASASEDSGKVRR
jgi:hypothetical protein